MSETRELKCEICESLLGEVTMDDGTDETLWTKALTGYVCGNRACYEAWLEAQNGGE